jgi:hypothetical protein
MKITIAITETNAYHLHAIRKKVVNMKLFPPMIMMLVHMMAVMRIVVHGIRTLTVTITTNVPLIVAIMIPVVFAFQSAVTIMMNALQILVALLKDVKISQSHAMTAVNVPLMIVIHPLVALTPMSYAKTAMSVLLIVAIL